MKKDHTKDYLYDGLPDQVFKMGKNQVWEDENGNFGISKIGEPYPKCNHRYLTVMLDEYGFLNKELK